MIGAADALAVEPGFSLILKEWTVEHPALARSGSLTAHRHLDGYSCR